MHIKLSASYKTLNLKSLKILKNEFRDLNLGFSDHSVGSIAAITFTV